MKLRLEDRELFDELVDLRPESLGSLLRADRSSSQRSAEA